MLFKVAMELEFTGLGGGFAGESGGGFDWRGDGQRGFTRGAAVAARYADGDGEGAGGGGAVGDGEALAGGGGRVGESAPLALPGGLLGMGEGG
jgi:hypothetical protein